MVGPALFKDLTFVDSMMMVKLLDFSNKVTEAYEHFDLRQVYDLTQRFLVSEVTDFYLDFTKFRRRRLA
jgi:isoleucyl-tRNA synthetase